jgi:hypothetical protein
MPETMLRRIGWVLSALVAMFEIGASALPKLAGMAAAKDSMAALNWPDAPLMAIGALEVVLAVLYLIPTTALLGAVLMMALLGGAIATNLHAGADLASHTLFGVYLGILMWLGLILRDPRIRAVFPLAR